MNRSKSLLVFAEEGREAGWKLGGAKAIAVTGPDALNLALDAEIEKDEAGIIAIPEPLRDSVSKQTLTRLSKTAFPMLVFYPTLGEKQK
jgi:vacuolar-type H+-ATPase subunit F/Vma7